MFWMYGLLLFNGIKEELDRIWYTGLYAGLGSGGLAGLLLGLFLASKLRSR